MGEVIYSSVNSLKMTPLKIITPFSKQSLITLVPQKRVGPYQYLIPKWWDSKGPHRVLITKTTVS